MKIATQFRDGDRGMTIEVDGIHARLDPETIAQAVADAVAEVLCHLWIPPDEPDQPARHDGCETPS